MPRPKFPPTPASSTEISAKDQFHMESSFSLPPPAIQSSQSQLTKTMQSSPPVSPSGSMIGEYQHRKRTLSGATKIKLDSTSSVDLPPPPSRARKIIQMKPKNSPPTVETKPSAASKAQATSPKRKQITTASAATRKTARKTAHSIIERRRRSKMNEEFGVLKDMIPACRGVEMHKLAILQAGIEYVRYLQGCIEQLQDNQGGIDNMQLETERLPQISTMAVDDSRGIDFRQDSIATTPTISTNPSPALKPSKSSADFNNSFIHPSTSYATSPPPLAAQTPLPSGVSPAFQAIHFSPDLTRSSTFSSTHQGSLSGKPSPQIAPLPQAALPIGGAQTDETAEAHATAALMMLTNDRRGSSRGGMSVKDLLSG